MTSESPGTRLIKQAFEGLTGSIKLPPTPSPYYDPPSFFNVKSVEFERPIPGIGKGSRIPDILLTDTNGRKIAVELYNTNLKTDAWIQDVASIGLLALEVDVYGLKPNFGMTSVERANELLSNAKWLNPGPPSDLKWVPYINILSYYQSCQTGFMLKRNGKDTLMLVLSDRGKWRTIAGHGEAAFHEFARETQEDLETAVNVAWASAHPGVSPSAIPPCPTLTWTGLEISDSSSLHLWDEYDKCVECLGVIPDVGLILTYDAHVNGQLVRMIPPDAFTSNRDNWAGYPLRFFLDGQPSKIYCWLCAALHSENDGWKFLSPNGDYAPEGEPPGFDAFCHWKLALAEEKRRIRYQEMEPGKWPDQPGVTDTLDLVENFLCQEDIEEGLNSLRQLRAYQPEGRARAVELAQAIVKSSFRQLPVPLRHAIESSSRCSPAHCP